MKGIDKDPANVFIDSKETEFKINSEGKKYKVKIGEKYYGGDYPPLPQPPELKNLESPEQSK